MALSFDRNAYFNSGQSAVGHGAGHGPVKMYVRFAPEHCHVYITALEKPPRWL
jgi:hypothetical protein